MLKRGLFIVLEGIDGSGTTTQINFLHDYLKSLSKYNDVLTTHEPWKSKEIKRKLNEEKDAYSDGQKMMELYVKDRKNHQEKLIKPMLNIGGIVLCDRYHLSTYAYQKIQGIAFEIIINTHKSNKIINPDFTIFLDVDFENARKRILKRGDSLEKFERDEIFTKKLINQYNYLYNLSKNDESLFGKIIRINGNPCKQEVFSQIKEKIQPLIPNYYKSD
ncbi:MAG: dTMP kinase [Nanoarchaeota archaeon]|nr:dTMP kinase [Nanoarchaeota archaeon]MBU4116277.1 dTMP kinase [Nanoarchaeota archaeon]